MTDQSEELRVDIAPEVSVLGVFRYLNYKPWFAVAEFVDNALDSFLTHRNELTGADGRAVLRVKVAIEAGEPAWIRVTDNAAGISREDWRRALRPAEPPPDTSQLSEFGMGMKTAGAWFGRLLLVRSKCLHEAFERTAFLDFDDIIATKRTSADVKASPANVDEHGTTVEVMGLHRVPQTKTIAKIKEHLASIYRSFLRSGQLELIFQSGSGPEERLEPEEVECLVAPRFDQVDGEVTEWQKPINIELNNGVQVSGFAGLRARGSTSKAGFALLRRGRLIVGSADETYRPSAIFGASTTAIYQRLFGELHIEGVDVTHTKDGFRWGDVEEDFIEALRAELDSEAVPLLQQARKISYGLQRDPTADLRMQATEAAEETADLIQRELPEAADNQLIPGDELEPDAELSQGNEIFSRTVSVEIDGEPWEITIQFSNDVEHDVHWVEVADRGTPSGDRKLALRMSLRHPFTARFAGVAYENLDLLIRLAAAVVLAEVFARQSGAKGAGEVRRLFNELLRYVFSRS